MTGFSAASTSANALFVIQWSMATALGWIFAHPLLQRYVLEASWLFLTTAVPLIALATFVAVLVRWRRRVQPRWWSIVTNTGWAVIILLSMVIRQAGSMAGVLQSLVLRRYISRSIRWTLASWLGALLTLQISNVLVAGDLVYLTLEGVLLGIMQWLILRREIAGAAWWVAASALGWLLGALVIFPGWTVPHSVGGKLGEHMALIVSHTIPQAMGGLLCGLITAVALLMLLKNRRVAD